MKRLIILALVCLNLALVAAVTFHAKPGTAYGQRRRGVGDYTVITGRRGSNKDTVYVIDTNSRLMRAWWLDTSRKNWRWQDGGVRDLDRDFPLESR